MSNNSPIIWDEGNKARMMNQGPLQFFNGTEIHESDGSPDGSLTAPKGSIALDRTNGKFYQNTNGTTAWRDLVQYITFATVAEAEAATPSGIAIAYIEEKKGVYNYCTTCDYPVDGDLVLNTGNGGNTRWELIQKMSRTQGDTGWITTDNATLSALNSTTVRLATSSICAIGIKGVRIPIPIGNYDITLSGAAGPKFIHFDDDTLTLKSRDSLWDFNTEVPVSVTYWDGVKIVAAPQTEFHGIRDTIWHLWAHRFLGLQYVSGLAFTGSVQTDNNTDPGATETVYNLWSTSGVIQDEDVQSTPGTGQWAQTLGSGLTETTAAIFPFFYFNGSFVTTNAAMADRAPFIHAGANTPPQWNNGGTLTAAITGDYIVYHYFVTPMTGGWAVFSRPHNAKYTSLALALAASPTQLTWTNYAELKHIYTAVFRVNTGWSNSHRCKLVSLRDFRLTAQSPTTAIAPTAHSGLSALELAAAGVTWGHIDDQAQTIAGAKTFSSHPLSTDADTPAGNELIPFSKLGAVVESLTNKATVVGGDRLLLSDSEAANAAKEVLVSAINTFVRTGLSTARTSTEIGYSVSAAVTSTTPGTSSTDVSGASITIGAGTWRLCYSVTAAYQTGNATGDYGNTAVFIADGSNNAVSGTPRMVFAKALGTGGQVVRACLSAEAPDDIVITGNTTYKLRCIREDGQGTGAGAIDALTYGGGYIKATRIR